MIDNNDELIAYTFYLKQDLYSSLNNVRLKHPDFDELEVTDKTRLLLKAEKLKPENLSSDKRIMLFNEAGERVSNKYDNVVSAIIFTDLSYAVCETTSDHDQYFGKHPALAMVFALRAANLNINRMPKGVTVEIGIGNDTEASFPNENGKLAVVTTLENGKKIVQLVSKETLNKLSKAQEVMDALNELQKDISQYRCL